MACTNNIYQSAGSFSCSAANSNKSAATPTKLILCSKLPSCKRASSKCMVMNRGQKTPSNDHMIRQSETAGLTGKFGWFGGIFVPETLVTSLNKLSAKFKFIMHDPDFQAELGIALKDYVGRETPLYFAQRLTDHYKNRKGDGPDIYLKREDLNYTGAHKINNAIAQAMLAKRMGREHVVTATGTGQHGVATAAACAKLDLDCTVIMGDVDMQRHSSGLLLMMQHLGAKVESVKGTFKDATSEAFRNWVGDLDNTYYAAGLAVGPHPCPSMVCEFQSIIGKETRKQAVEKWGGMPDVIVACVGTGFNAIGIFHEFVSDEEVRLIGVEAAGNGIDNGMHSTCLAKGELSFLKKIGRAEFYTVTDNEALDAYALLCQLEGIVPALESAHALAYLQKLCPTLPNGSKVVVNCSGRGDKDVATVFTHQAKRMVHQVIRMPGLL